MLGKQNRGIKQFRVLVNLLRDHQAFLEKIRQGFRVSASQTLFKSGFGRIIILE